MVDRSRDGREIGLSALLLQQDRVQTPGACQSTLSYNIQTGTLVRDDLEEGGFPTGRTRTNMVVLAC